MKVVGAVCPVSGLIVIPDPSDMALVNTYMRMLSERVRMPDGPDMSLLDIVFYEEPPQIMDYIEICRNASAVILGCESLNQDAATIAGISWVTSMRKMGGGKVKGEIGFCFFNGISPFKKLALARKMRDYAFGLGLDVLFGTTPEQNIKAVRFSRLLGFDTSDKVRNYTTWRGHTTDVVVSHLTREKWEEIRGRSN